MMKGWIWAGMLWVALGVTLGVPFAGDVHGQTPAERLAEHTEEFRREVITVTEGVHVAIGYALANSILIEGDDGVIIVDTTESPQAAQEILAEFRGITEKPVRAIVYTHFHADHIGGARVFAGEDEPEVIAHRLTDGLVQDSYSLLLPIIQARSLRQFGVPVTGDGFLNCGIGPRLRISGTGGYLPATTLVDDALEMTIAGVRLKFVHAPGETNDQLYVWLPDKKVLLPGDNFYKSFPNLYAIRGTRYRDVREWASSLDRMLGEGAAFLVPSHTRPIVGEEVIRERLTNYRDAIRFVHDETVRGMNQGMTPDELVAFVRLPEALGADPWLAEFYGTVAWSVRAIFNGYLGWFDGNATNLSPLAPRDRAGRIAALAGGADGLLRAAREALEAGEAQWAAELADMLLALESDVAEARAIKRVAFELLAEEQTSANGRNYYLTSGQQLGR